MAYRDFDDEIWDEHRWEAHLDEIERQSETLRRFISSDPSGNLPRWLALLRESTDELDAVDAFIEEELQIDDAYYPDEEEWEDEEFDEDPFLFEEEDDMDAGEDWKELSGEYALSNYGSIENLEMFNDARGLAAFVLQWAEGIPPASHTAEYHEFVGTVLRIGAKLAGGYSFGFDLETLGGNIAYTKKGLHCANEALELLQVHLKRMPAMDLQTYRLLHERLFSLRNTIGIYIQDLREEFRAGRG